MTKLTKRQVPAQRATGRFQGRSRSRHGPGPDEPTAKTRG